MSHEFAEFEDALEPQASSSRSGGPPRKLTSIGTLDPPFPPKPSHLVARHAYRPGSIPSVPSSMFFRVVAGVILIAVVVTLFFLLLARHSTG